MSAPSSSLSDLGIVGEQIGRSGPFFTAFLPHSRAFAAANAAKTVLAGADFRFRRPKSDRLLAPPRSGLSLVDLASQIPFPS